MANDATPANVVVGVDVGGTKVAMLAWDLDASAELARDRFPTPADAGPTEMVDQLCEAIGHLLDSASCPPTGLRALGMAVPGPVDPKDGRVLIAGNLAGWQDVPLRAILSQRLGVPAWVEQDANAAALGERWQGAARELRDFVFVALGTGIGAGVVLDGRLHRGANHHAGEIGNFVMSRARLGKERDGHGDLELLIGSPAIKRAARQAVRDDVAAAEAIDKADEDRRLKRLASHVVDYLAITVVNVAALLDPEAIVFGGGTAAAGDDFLARVRQRVERELRVPPALMYSVLGEDAQLCGAVWGAQQAREAAENRSENA